MLRDYFYALWPWCLIYILGACQDQLQPRPCTTLPEAVLSASTPCDGAVRAFGALPSPDHSVSQPAARQPALPWAAPLPHPAPASFFGADASGPAPALPSTTGPAPTVIFLSPHPAPDSAAPQLSPSLPQPPLPIPAAAAAPSAAPDFAQAFAALAVAAVPNCGCHNSTSGSKSRSCHRRRSSSRGSSGSSSFCSSSSTSNPPRTPTRPTPPATTLASPAKPTTTSPPPELPPSPPRASALPPLLRPPPPSPPALPHAAAGAAAIALHAPRTRSPLVTVPASAPWLAATLRRFAAHARADDLLHSAAARAYHTTSIPHHAGGF